MAGKVISRNIFGNGFNIGVLLAVSLSIGVLAGLYPAVSMPRFKVINVLKGQLTSGRTSIRLRRVLVVLQFTISIILIFGTLVAFRQLHYMRNQPLGFKKDQLLAIDFGGDSAVQNHYKAIKQELLRVPNVLAASTSSSIPGSGYENGLIKLEDNTGQMQTAGLGIYSVDYDFFNEYQIKVVAGRDFSRDFQTDSADAVIVNEACAAKLGYRSSAEIIGKRFSLTNVGEIVGVVRNFHFRSLKDDILPLVFHIDNKSYRLISLNIAATNIPFTIAAIQNKWKALCPRAPFNYFFVDEAFDSQYREEVHFEKLLLYFSVFAVFISCLGLFGLALFSILQRLKEIATRKVLGASVWTVVNLLAMEFLKLVLIAFVIASPLAWFFMNKWLQGFAYRITIDIWVFGEAGLIALIVALLTVSTHAFKAALANPIKGLRGK